MFNQILIPTDGSKEVTPAVEVGCEIAHTHGATIHILYVVKQQQRFAEFGGGVGWWDDLMEELERKGKRVTAKVAGQADDIDVDITTAVRRGTPRHEIPAYADDYDIDLIVMGTHRRTGVKRALMGSVTEAVVRHAETPVLTVSRDTEPHLKK